MHINCIHSKAKNRIIISTAPHRTNIRNFSEISINCHKASNPSLNRHFIYHISLCYSILRKRRFYIVYHNRNRSFSNGFGIKSFLACQRIDYFCIAICFSVFSIRIFVIFFDNKTFLVPILRILRCN